MKVEEENEKAGLKLNIQKTKIMVSGSITSWQIEEGRVEAVTDFIFFFLFFNSKDIFIYLFLFVVDFVIHWNETAMGLHVFPIPIPPPTSLSTRSL